MPLHCHSIPCIDPRALRVQQHTTAQFTLSRPSSLTRQSTLLLPQGALAPPPSLTLSDDKLDLIGHDSEDAFECSEAQMLAGGEDVYLGHLFDHLTADKALEHAFESVVQHASKASQEHLREPHSIAEVMQCDPEERSCWLKAATDEIHALVENSTFELVRLPPGRKAIGSR